MTTKIECEIYIAINEDGGWIVTADPSEALNNLAENEGGEHGRVVKLTVQMSPPVLQETKVDVADEAGTTEKLVVEAV